MSEIIVAALAGNPNAGKTTLFNALTGARQHVGNYPGITVEKKEGDLHHEGVNIHVVDLPGTYSLTAYSQEELVARCFLAEERPDVVIDVLNAGALERNLYLAVQIMEMGAPLVLALNMMDEVRKQGLTIDSALLERLTGVPVVETVARHGQGKENLLSRATKTARAAKGRPWTPLSISYGPDLDPVLAEMTASIESASFLTERYPARWVALKYLEGDEEIRVLGRKTGPLAQVLEDSASRVADHCRRTLSTYPEAIIADYRYGYITAMIRKGVLRRDTHRDRIAMSDRIDRVLTHKLAGPLVMFAILYIIYKITFGLGGYPMELLGDAFAWLGETVEAVMPDGLLRSLIVSGIIDGVGGVFSFVPLVMLMFMLIAFLEDSGYMARIAYMLDRVFRTFGLHGCSVMPYIVSGGIAGGCAVPGVMASRTLRSPREKLATLLTAPFMTCGAKLPVFILLIGAFFPDHQASAMFTVTLGAWAVALLVAKALRSTVVRGPATPFVMELPPYRLPTVQGLLIHTWERTWQYLKKAGSVILAISILLWAAMTFPGLPADRAAEFDTRTAQAQTAIDQAAPDQQEELTAALKAIEDERAEATLVNSYAGRAGTALEGVTRLAGFDWRMNIALVGGIAAKEVIVSTLGTAYSLGSVEADDSASLADRLKADPSLNRVAAISLITFILLYSPCFVTIVAIAKESGSWGWAAFSAVFNTLLAFALSVGIYQLGNLV